MDLSYDKLRDCIRGKSINSLPWVLVDSTGYVFTDMNLGRHRFKLECVGESCSIDDPECEACEP